MWQKWSKIVAKVVKIVQNDQNGQNSQNIAIFHKNTTFTIKINQKPQIYY
jgi:hypothetical protein